MNNRSKRRKFPLHIVAIYITVFIYVVKITLATCKYKYILNNKSQFNGSVRCEVSNNKDILHIPLILTAIRGKFKSKIQIQDQQSRQPDGFKKYVKFWLRVKEVFWKCFQPITYFFTREPKFECGLLRNTCPCYHCKKFSLQPYCTFGRECSATWRENATACRETTVRPVSSKIFKYFYCNKWTPYVSLKVAKICITKKANPYTLEHWERYNFKGKLSDVYRSNDSLVKFSLKTANNYDGAIGFATNGTHTAAFLHSFGHNLKSLYCATVDDAQNFNCKIAPKCLCKHTNSPVMSCEWKWVEQSFLDQKPRTFKYPDLFKIRLDTNNDINLFRQNDHLISINLTVIFPRI